MAKTPSQRAAAYRDRIGEKIGRLENGHRAIVARLDGNAKPLAIELRAISQTALGET